MKAFKVIVTSKSNLVIKYGKEFKSVKALLTKLVANDKKQDLKTKIIFVDDAVSAGSIGMKALSSIRQKPCKDFVDALYKKYKPAYIVIFGSQDIFPFQEITNQLYQPGEDDDQVVSSDLPYACDSSYSKNVTSFINPVRVVGRIPDIPGKADINFLTALFKNIIAHRAKTKPDYQRYFAVSADVWRASTQESIHNIYGNTNDLRLSPPAKGGYTKRDLKPLSHFYNCHGALSDPNYYGQKGSSYPVALRSKDLSRKVSAGTVVAAECCYGAQVLNPADAPSSVASNYLLHGAVSFIGSSTIAYGPTSGQGLADLICQYFIINIQEGASAGRALLEARQKFLQTSGPHLDPYELKTLAQFYTLGDPSLSIVENNEPKVAAATIENRRLNLFSKGIALGQSMAPAVKTKKTNRSRHKKEIQEILKETGFTKNLNENVYETRFKSPKGELKKVMTAGKTRYRTFEKSFRSPVGFSNLKVLVVKENDDQVLGYRVYVSR